MHQLSAARSAIASEINFLKAEQARLTAILAQLGGNESATPVTGAKRGRKPGSKNGATKATSSAADLSKALELLKDAGKTGIKAIKLSYMLKAAGNTKVSKTELLDSGQVKMTGKGGASTYVYLV